MSDQHKMQQRINSMRQRLRDVPPTTQLANLFGALWRDAEDDVTVLIDQVVILRRSIAPMVEGIDPDVASPTMREMLRRMKTAYDESKFVEDWKNLK